MLRSALILGCLLSIGPAASVTAQTVSPPGRGANYHVRFDPRSMEARVDATLTVSDGKLAVSATGAWNLPGGDWRAHLRDVTVRDSAGRLLRLAPDTSGGWQVEAGEFAGLVRMEYVVNLAFAAAPSDLPRTTTGYRAANGLVTMTAPLFVYSPLTEAGSRVTIDVPAGWFVVAPWHETGERSYSVSNTARLVGNAIVFSNKPPLRVQEGNFTVVISLLDDFEALGVVIRPVVTAQLRAALAMMPDPGTVHHLLVFFPDKWDTGEALESANIMSSRQAPLLTNVSLWGKTLAHELVHYWNGHMVSGTDWAASQWFSEGATEYLASLTQLRAGTIDETGFFNHMRKHLHLYLLFQQRSVHEDVSLVQAGLNKGRNNAAIYDGGALAALCYDGMIREATAGRAELSNVVAALVAEAGADGYSNEEIVQQITRLTGSEAAELFASAIAGTGRLPLERCFARYGYHLGVNALDVELRPDAAATDLQNLLRFALRTPTRVEW